MVEVITYTSIDIYHLRHNLFSLNVILPIRFRFKILSKPQYNTFFSNSIDVAHCCLVINDVLKFRLNHKEYDLALTMSKLLIFRCHWQINFVRNKFTFLSFFYEKCTFRYVFWKHLTLNSNKEEHSNYGISNNQISGYRSKLTFTFTIYWKLYKGKL